MRKKNTLKIGIICLIMLILVHWSNKKISVKNYEISTEKVTAALRIVVVTDLHSCYYGQNQEDLIRCVTELNPDLILLGGDIVDDVIPRKNSLIFLEAIGKAYPCYYVSGNHELRSGKLDEIKTIVRNFDINVLEGDTKRIVLKQQMIQICGLDDFAIGESTYKLQLDHINRDRDRAIYTILIDHRPEHINNYINDEIDLIVSGHAHGGQWRIPGLLNGVYAPNQGLFPKFAGGLYTYDTTMHVVSRGLAKESTRIPRLFNPPELVVVDITPKS